MSIRLQNWSGKTLKGILGGQKLKQSRSSGEELLLWAALGPLPSPGDHAGARPRWKVRPETHIKHGTPQGLQSQSSGESQNHRWSSEEIHLSCLSWVEEKDLAVNGQPPVACSRGLLIHLTSQTKKHHAEDLVKIILYSCTAGGNIS